MATSVLGFQQEIEAISRSTKLKQVAITSTPADNHVASKLSTQFATITLSEASEEPASPTIEDEDKRKLHVSKVSPSSRMILKDI